MLKIFLVEDEYVVREGIKRINWQAHGYEFAGEAPDGELALPLIDKTRPDIVITDIKMPFMDGLELSRQLRRDYPETEIIILSGYAEFSYAREAVNLGVSRFLTKPISPAELIEQIDQIRDQIEEKQRERSMQEQYRKDVEEDLKKARKDFFLRLVTGSGSVSEILEQASELEIELKAAAYQIILAGLESRTKSKDEYSASLERAQAELETWIETEKIIAFDREEEGHAILVMADSKEALRDRVNQIAEGFTGIAGKYKSLKYYLGVGLAAGRVGEIARSFDTARAAYAHRFFDRNSGMVWAEDRPRGPAGEDTDLVHVNPNTFERARLQDFLKTGEESEIPYFVDETFDHLEGESGKSLMFRQYITMDIYFIVREFMTRLDPSVDETGIPAPDAAVSSTTRAMRDYCSLLVTEAVRARNSVSGNRHRDVVDLVISHIESNYADENLSLQTLADLVHFSPSHLSVIFSQQTGETLSKYLINYRIGKAKEALCCTSKKSSQIAEETGYRDPHYFSYMFKKVTGMTPTQYREKVTGMTPTQYREKATGMAPAQTREKASGMASAPYREQYRESKTGDELRQRG